MKPAQIPKQPRPLILEAYSYLDSGLYESAKKLAEQAIEQIKAESLSLDLIANLRPAEFCLLECQYFLGELKNDEMQAEIDKLLTKTTNPKLFSDLNKKIATWVMTFLNKQPQTTEAKQVDPAILPSTKRKRAPVESTQSEQHPKKIKLTHKQTRPLTKLKKRVDLNLSRLGKAKKTNPSTKFFLFKPKNESASIIQQYINPKTGVRSFSIK